MSFGKTAIGSALITGVLIGGIAVSRNFNNIMDLSISTDDRVKRAYDLAEEPVRDLCRKAKLDYPPKRVFLRAFKAERELELWGADDGTKPFRLVKIYDIAGMSGTLGPKRKEGDLQVPEGIYFIHRFNPRSRFRLSLGINYPNASDRKRSDPAKPGGDIFIHGDTRSIGCLAMTDKMIDQIYILCLGAKSAGQSKIPVHIFPFRMQSTAVDAQSLKFPQHKALWTELKPIYDAFEKQRFVPKSTVDSSGKYRLAPSKS